MSYFKSRTSETSETTTNFRNAFLLKEQPLEKTFDIKIEEFPDLLGSIKDNKKNDKKNDKKNEDTKSNNYVNIAATPTVKEIQVVEVPSGWVQYSRNKVTGKTTITHGKKSNYELVRDKRLLYEAEPHFINAMILKELSSNWNKYKINYDKIHGHNAYDEIYYCEPIYPNLDSELNSDEESESDYFNDSNYTYHYDSN